MIFDFFDSPELLDIQRTDFYHFLNEGIPQLLAKQFPIKIKNGSYSLELCLNEKNVKLLAPEDNPRDCILKMKTYNCKLYAQVKIVCKKSSSFGTKEKIVYQGLPEWVLLGQLPIMTKRGHFIINGSPRVIVHQVVRSPGIYFQKLLKKDDQNKDRFYGDIIPLKGVWVRLQMTKKGRVEAKFKKGKKVEVELLQKCLQVVENQTFSRLRDSFPKEEDPRFLLYDDYSKLLSKKKSRAESKAEHDAFVHTYDRLYRTTQDKELEEWQKKKKNQKFFKGSCITHFKGQNDLFTSGAAVRSVQIQDLSGAQSGLSLGAKKEKADLYSGNPDRQRSQLCKLNGKKDWILPPLQTKSKRLDLNEQDPAFGSSFAPESTFKQKRCSENLFATFKIQSRYDLGLLGREKIDTKFGLHRKDEQCYLKANGSSLHLRKGVNLVSLTSAFKRNANFGQRSSLVQRFFARKSFFGFLQNKASLITSCPKVIQSRSLYATLQVSPSYKSWLQSRTKLRVPVQSFALQKEKICTLFTTTCPKGTQSFVRRFVQGKKIQIENLSEGDHTKRTLVRKQISIPVQSSALLALTKQSFVLNKSKICKSCLFASHGQLPFCFARAGGFATKALPPRLRHQTQRARHEVNKVQILAAKSYKASLYNARTKQSFVCRDLYEQRSKDLSNANTQLTALDICSATLWLYRLRRGEQSTDDIDHSQNRRVRTSGELLQAQFENGVYRLRNLLSTKLQEWKGDRSSPIFSSIFKASFKTRYSSKVLYFKGSRNADLSYIEKKNLATLLSRHQSGDPTKQSFVRTCSCNRFCNPLPYKFPVATCKKICICNLYKATATKKAMQKKRKREFFPQPSLWEETSNTMSYKLSAKELFTTKPITGALREFFGSNPLSQYMDQTNPLAEITHKRRISSLGVGGVSRESAGMAIRGIHPTHYGRICPIETPEGKNAGLVNSLAFCSMVDKNGSVKTPYYRVFKGQVQSSLGFSFCSARDELLTGLQIAPSDLQRSRNNILRTKSSTLESVPVRVADNFLDIFKKENPYKVELIATSPIQMISVATSLIPFLEHNDANRALMGSNMQRQAVPLMISERPVVGTGLESIVVIESGHITESRRSGFASHVVGNQVVVDSLLYKKKESFSSLYAVPCSAHAKARKLSQKVTKKVESRKVRLETEGNRQSLSLFLPKDKTFKKRFGDKVLILSPSSVLKRMKGESQAAKQFSKKSQGQMVQRTLDHPNKDWRKQDRYRTKLFFRKMWKKSRLCTKEKESFLTSTISPLTTFFRSNQNTCITERPLVRELDWIQKGDVLSDCSASKNGELAVGKNVLIAYIPWEGYNFEDAIVISDRLVREHVYTSLHIERYVFQAQDLKDGNEWFTKHLPGVEPRAVDHLEESGLPKIGSFLKEGNIIVGKIRYLNKKPSSPYERLLCDILGEKNFAARNKSLYVPKGVEARVVYHKIISFFDNDSTNKVRPTDAAKTVHLFLGEKRVIQVGDKISGRHGNKGVISTILPREDMPYLPDGTPIDIVLNPLGVPSRMNVGQVLECLLGLAATYLGQHFKIAAFDERYGVEASKSIVFLKLYQARLLSGQSWLFQVAFPGKTRLVDGRSGECFDQWITVGRAYILKLIHMVSEKIHARSTGPYALITQQPLRGRSNKGGQRLGEMEVWALEGFGAAYTLQELLTKKSDDSFGRKQIVDSILPSPVSVVDTLKPFARIDRNKNVLGHPEIFKVLLCELQALCLDLGVYAVTPDSFQRSFLGRVH